MQNMQKLIPVIVVAVLAVSAGSFYGGMKYATSKNPTNILDARMRQFEGAPGAMRLGNGAGGGVGMIRGGGLVNGEVLNLDDKSATIKLRDGGSKIVLFGASTEVVKSVTGTVADLVVGQTLMVTGDTNPDGSVTAKSIQVRPNLPIPVPADQIQK
jgi:hypothetical protein